MNKEDPKSVEPSTDPIGVRLIVLLVALAGFMYLFIRLFQTWGQWPEDAWTSGFRIVELGLVSVFVLWSLAYVLWPKSLEKPTEKNDQGEVAGPNAGPERVGK